MFMGYRLRADGRGDAADVTPKRFKRLCRAAGMQIASEVIDMFPEEFGLGVIKGGLALLFEVRPLLRAFGTCAANLSRIGMPEA